MIRTANPALNDNQFGNFDLSSGGDRSVMTMAGAVHKTTILLVLLLLGAAYTWYVAAQAGEAAAPGNEFDAMSNAAFPWMIGGGILGFIIALVTIFKKSWSPFTAPLYAIAEGAFLGALSCVVNAQFQGVAIQAVGCTFGVLAVMLTLYMTRIIKPNKKLMIGIAAATGGVCLFYVVEIILGFFGAGTGLLAFNNGSPISIAVSGVIVVIAALNLVLDFAFIEDQSQRGAPKYMEWFAAFGLLVTLVWLYLEILRLLAKLQSRD